MRLYGSVNNRFEENRQYCDTIKVGTGVTEYMYSDRHPYEVTKVITQEHVFIRAMDHERIDNNGMSDVQEYKYISNKNNKELEVVKRNNRWYTVSTWDKATMMEKAAKDTSWKTPESAYKYYLYMSGLSDKQIARLNEGKTVKKYNKINISFGVMEEYYDFSF